MTRILILSTAVFFHYFNALVAQDKPDPITIFEETRIINGHSVAVLPHRDLDFRITHKFGDIGGENGGGKSLWGFDNASDIRIAFEYGLTSDLTLGLGRSKGAGPWKQVFDCFGKYNILNQTMGKQNPFSLTILGLMNFTAMPASENVSDATSFGKFVHRINYITQILFARKIGDRASLQLMPTFVHRNYTAYNERNALFYLGFAGRYKLSKALGLLVEYFPHLLKSNDADFKNAYGVGLEINSGRHVFTINLTNSRAINEGQFLAATTAMADKGEVRLGFTITRPFKM